MKYAWVLRGDTPRKVHDHEHSIFHVYGGHIKPILCPHDRGIQTELALAGANGVHLDLLHWMR